MWFTQFLKFCCLSCKLQVTQLFTVWFQPVFPLSLGFLLTYELIAPSYAYITEIIMSICRLTGCFIYSVNKAAGRGTHNVPPTWKRMSPPACFHSLTLKWYCCHLMVSHTHSILLKGKKTKTCLMLTQKHLFYCSQCSEAGCQNTYKYTVRMSDDTYYAKIQRFRSDQCKSCLDHIIDHCANICIHSFTVNTIAHKKCAPYGFCLKG